MKLKKLFQVSFFIIVLASCNDFLDTELEGSFTSSSFYKTESQALLAVNSIYNIAMFNNPGNNLWVFGDVASDDTVKGGNDGDQSDIGFINDFKATPDNGAIEAIWQHYYEGISRANNVIYFVPDIDMDITLRNRIVGEAKFLRAYYYFHLVNIFGKIPLKLEPVFSVKDMNLPLSEVNLIYTQIVTDLEDAALVLPEKYSSELGRATKGAALGLLAKVYLFQEDWTSTLAIVEDIDLLGYSLMNIYSQNFSVNYENNKESIFEIQHLSAQVPSLGSFLNQYFSPSTLNGYYFNAPTKSFVDEFEVTANSIVDPRLDYTVGYDGNTWVDGQLFLPSWSPATGFLGKKHCNNVAQGDPIGDGELNYTFMRYSEVLLMKAEALNELNRTSEALVPLNKIRKRARESYLYDADLPGFGSVPNDLLPDVTAVDKISVRAAIQHERRVELGLEFHRYYDLMRYGKVAAEDALNDVGFDYGLNRYFPIPQSELDTNTNI